jgi:tripartite ATP-independent transporter DctP family solute receptor
MKRLAVLSICLLFILSMAAGTAIAAEFTIKYAVSAPDTSFHAEFARKFKAEAEKNSNGRIKVNVYGGGQLGSEQDNVQGCSTNMIQMSTVAVNNLAPFAPAIGVLTLPYILPDIESAYKLLANPYMDTLNKDIVAKSNVRVLSWLIGGYRVLTNSKKPVKVPADMDGLKVRVPKNEIMLQTYKAWGVNPVPMAWSEVFNALQQRVIDAQDNPHIVNTASKFYEVQKYITDIHYMLWTGPCMMSESFYQKLPDDLKKVVKDAAMAASKHEWKWVADMEAKALKECTDKGMTFIKPEKEKEEWMAKARSVWPNFYESVGGKAAVDKVLAIIAK